jgi:hypothetical protein
VLVLGWGSTYGPIGAALRRSAAGSGRPGAPAPPEPVPANLGDVLRRYDKVLVPEMNLGQLRCCCAPVPVDVIAYNQVRGLPFTCERARRHADRRPHTGDAGPHLSIEAPVERAAEAHARTSRPTRRSAGARLRRLRDPGRGAGFMPELGIAGRTIVFVSGIGCSSRFPYYMNTYGMHSIHGRRPAIATGLSPSRPTCRSGSSPATATRCRSAATT